LRFDGVLMDEQLESYPEPKFDKLTEERIRLIYTEKIKKKTPEVEADFLKFETNVFIARLQDFGSAIPELLKFYPPKQQKRRESIKSIGSALLRGIDQFEKLDSGARGYLFWRGIEELCKATGEPNPFPEGMRTSLHVHAYKDEAIIGLRAFAEGVLMAEKELPEKQDKPVELMMALWIEGLFWENGLSFTISKTGFAAECLRAVLALGGIDKDSVDYWLDEARKHPESMSAYENRRKSDEKLR
jgi:hypothetical protein